MKKIPRIGISVLLGILAVMLVIWLAPTPAYQPSGILLPAEKTRSPIDKNSVVRILLPPVNAQNMGSINIERYKTGQSSPQYEAQEIWTLAKQYAATVGANAVRIDELRIARVTPKHYIYLFRARAYYLPTTQNILEPIEGDY